MAIKQAVPRLGRGIDGEKTQGAGANCIWIGGGADNLWTNALNWDRLPVAGDNLIFDGTTRLTPSNDFAAATSFNSITFAPGAGAFTLSTNSITLTGDVLNQSSNAQIIALAVALTQIITINTEAQSIYLTGAWSGTGGGWTKLGTGTLYVKATCTATGATTISEGTQNHGDGGAAGNVGSVSSFVNNGALVYQRSNSISSGYSISGSGTVTNNGASGFTNTLSGTNTYTGATRVMAGTLLAGSVNAFGNNSAVTLDNVAGAVLDTTGFSNLIGSLTGGGATGGNITLGATTLTIGGDNTSPAAYSGVISGTGNIIKSGTGTLTLSALNTYTGTTWVQNGTLSINTIKSVSGGSSSVGAPTTVANGTIKLGFQTFSGTLKYTGAVQSTDRVIDLPGTSGGAILDQSGSGLWTFTSAFTGTGAGGRGLTLQGSTASGGAISGLIVNGSGTTSLTKGGTGTWTLSAINPFTGAVVVNSGTLSVATPNSASGSLGKSSAITINSGGTIACNDVNSLVGFDELNNQTLTINSGGTLSNPGTAFATHLNAVVLNGGSITAASPEATFGNWSFDFTVSTPGTGNTSTISGGNCVFNQTGGSIFSVGAGDTINMSTVATALGGVNTGLIKNGTGILILSGTNTFTAAVTFNAGTLVPHNNAAFGASNTVTCAGGVTIKGTDGANYTYANAFALTSGTITFSIPFTAGSDLGISGIVSGAGAILVTSDVSGRALTLTGNNTFSGGITLGSTTSSARLIAGHASAFGTNSVTIDQSGSAGVEVNNPYTIANNFVVNSGKTLRIGANNSSAVTLSGIISSSGGLEKLGSGTWTLNGVNTYTGATTISAGVLTLTGSLASGSAISLAGGSFTGPTGTLATATAAGTISVGNAAASILRPGAFGNNVLNTGALTFVGTSSAFTADSTAITFSKVAVTGNVALGAMDITCPAGITLNGTYKIITATGTMSGTLPTVVSNSTGKVVTPQQTGNDLELVIS